MHQAETLYCKKDFENALDVYQDKPGIYDAFLKLAAEIDKRKGMEVIHWYSISTQWLRANVASPDKINPLFIFKFQAESFLQGTPPGLQTAAYVAAIVGITIGVLLTGLAIGAGIGLIMGLWATPMGFLTALLAAEQAAVIAAAASATFSVAAAAVSTYLFFKPTPLEAAVHTCISKIKENGIEEEALASPAVSV